MRIATDADAAKFLLLFVFVSKISLVCGQRRFRTRFAGQHDTILSQERNVLYCTLYLTRFY